jgi:hypothetical protein
MWEVRTDEDEASADSEMVGSSWFEETGLTVSLLGEFPSFELDSGFAEP